MQHYARRRPRCKLRDDESACPPRVPMSGRPFRCPAPMPASLRAPPCGGCLGPLPVGQPARSAAPAYEPGTARPPPVRRRPSLRFGAAWAGAGGAMDGSVGGMRRQALRAAARRWCHVPLRSVARRSKASSNALTTCAASATPSSSLMSKRYDRLPGRSQRGTVGRAASRSWQSAPGALAQPNDYVFLFRFERVKLLVPSAREDGSQLCPAPAGTCYLGSRR